MGFPVIVNILLFILACGALSCIIAMLYLGAQGEKKISLKVLPAMETRPLLSEKEAALRLDLEAATQKFGLVVFAKVGLGEFLQTREEINRGRYREALMPYEVDFAVCERQTGIMLLAIMPVEHGQVVDPRHEFIIKALGKVGVPYIQLGNYNRAGLEKAIKEHLGSKIEAALPEGKTDTSAATREPSMNSWGEAADGAAVIGN